MGEIKENESKSEFVEIKKENNVKVRKSRKRKRATEPVRHFKTMRLAKEVRKIHSAEIEGKLLKIGL